MAREQKIIFMGDTLPQRNGMPDLILINAIEELPKKGAWAVVIGQCYSHDKIALLSRIRALENYRYLPVFSEGTLLTEEFDLFDGEFDEQFRQKAAAIHERLALVSAENLTSQVPEMRLINYMFCRPCMKIGGRLNYHNPKIFEYPLLNVLFSVPESFDGWRFLQDLVVANWLSPCILRNEIQTCGTCNSGLLNIKQTCPSCHSVNVKPQKFVHCYTCGKIGPVPEFLRQERLYCVRCNTHLKVLGVDFDKPIEDKLCLDCGHYFSETALSYLCLVCEREQMEHELSARKLYDYVLTKQAEFIVCGIERGIFSNYNQVFKVMDYPTFMAIVGWKATLAERYPGLFFSVMTLQIANARELIESKGIVAVEKLVGELFSNLRDTFRDTDISTRHKGTMYFFLPMTDAEGCVIIINRLKQFVNDMAKKSKTKGLALGLSYISSSEMINTHVHGELMLNEVHARIVKSNACLIS